MKRITSIKRLAILALNAFSLVLYAGLYAYSWFHYYYPVVNNNNLGIKLFLNGHILVILMYLTVLGFLSRTYGSLKIGYLKPGDVIFSQAFSLLAVNVFAYFQISLMNNWIVEVRPMAYVFMGQIAIAVGWAFLCDFVYKKLFPPRNTLLVYGMRPIEDIEVKFSSRKDRFHITKSIHISADGASGDEVSVDEPSVDGVSADRISAGIAAVKKEAGNAYGAVVLWDIPSDARNHLIKYFYSQSIRVYMMPKITDVLIKGSAQLHLFDTPVFLTREYALTIEQRITKRLFDISLSLPLIMITSPLMLITALIIRISDKGPALYRQVRCTAGGKEFNIIKFRSMMINAESDGIARLAGRRDERITPFGRFIRAVRIDELPQLFNILAGDMSFIGPRPERPEIIARYIEQMPEFSYRLKMKAGLGGYAQVYGKYNTTPYDKLKLDLTYIENYTLWLDVKLMILTIKTIFKPDSAEGI